MFQKFIQSQRKRHGLTQEYIASKLGISRPTYMQIERGERELTVSEAKKLAAVFDMSLEDLLAENAPKYDVVLEKQKGRKDRNLKIRVPRESANKFKEVLLYVLGKVGSKPNVGETVLYKLLYFIDFDYYEKFEETLMGAMYIKNHHGPTPVAFKKIVEEMKSNGQIEQVQSKYFKFPQKKHLPLKPPDLKQLSARELEHIDGVLARLSDKNAKELSDYSHEDIPWKSAKLNQLLSYESVFYRDEKYSVRSYDDDL